MNNQNKRLIVLTIFLLCLGNFSIKAQTLINLSKDRPALQLNESMENVSFTWQTNQLSLESAQASDGQNYIILNMGENFNTTKTVGMPQLPEYNRLIQVPYGARISIMTSNVVSQTYDLNDYYKNKVMPRQASRVKNNEDTTFVINPEAYKTNKFIGEDLVKVEIIGIMGSVRLARLSICPIKYNPETNVIEVVKSFCAKITFPGADMGATIKAKQKGGSTSFIDSKTLNNKNLSSVTSSGVMDRPLKLVVVSDTMFKETLAPFLAWKRQQGFNVIEAYIGENGLTKDTNSIRSYLTNIYNNATQANPAADYLLLCGDDNLVPTFSGAYVSYGSSEYFPTDLYYAEYTGDYLPDLFYGRFSARTKAQMQHIVAKTMSYEKYQMEDTTHLSKVLLIAGKETGNDAPTYGNGQVNYVKGYVAARPNTDTLIYYNPASGDYSSQIKDSISTNGYGFINYSAHCSETGWYSPALSTEDINNTITNTGKYPLFINNCCLSNKFSESECFGEAILRAENKGGVGAIGGTCYTYWDGDYYWSVGAKSAVVNPSYNASELGIYDRLFHSHNENYSKWNVAAGQLTQAGNLAVLQANVSEDEYYFQIYHVLGDPTLIPYIGIPQNNINNIPDTMPVGITSLQLVCAPYSYVGISKGDTLLGAAQADSLGTANINFSSPINQVGYVKVVITTQFAKPIIDSIYMSYEQNALIAVSSISFEDSNNNSTSELKNNNTYFVNLNIENLGLASLDSVSLSLNNGSNSVMFDSLDYIGLMAGQSSQTLTHAFKIRIPDGVLNSSIATFSINIKGHNYLVTNNYSFEIKAPQIAITNVSLVAANGFTAGQDVQFKFNIKNSGANTLSAGMLRLSNLSSNLTLTSDSIIAFTSLQKDTSTAFVATFHINSLSNTEEYLIAKIFATAGAYSVLQLDSIPLRYTMETFESGTLTNFAWSVPSSHPWKIDSITQNAYQGTHSLRSGAISDSQSSIISLTSLASMTDTISFYIRTSTEQGYDIAYFYIDEAKKLELSGSNSWKKYAFVVDSGSHTYKWVYTKDNYLSKDSDAVWIDNVSLPSYFTQSSLNSVSAKENQITIYPNPAKDIVYVKGLKAQSTLTLFDCMGKAVKTNISYGVINVSSLIAGTYYLQIKQSNSIEIKKIIIAR